VEYIRRPPPAEVGGHMHEQPLTNVSSPIKHLRGGKEARQRGVVSSRVCKMCIYEPAFLPFHLLWIHLPSPQLSVHDGKNTTLVFVFLCLQFQQESPNLGPFGVRLAFVLHERLSCIWRGSPDLPYPARLSLLALRLSTRGVPSSSDHFGTVAYPSSILCHL
jgi:hypothetical protein